MSDYVGKYVLNPCGWLDADYVEIGAADTFGFTEFIVLEKGKVKRKYLPERTCTFEPESFGLLGQYKCSSCKDTVHVASLKVLKRLHYCPNCGAKVVEQ